MTVLIISESIGPTKEDSKQKDYLRKLMNKF